MIRVGGHHPFTQKCLHCGFPKWEEPPEKANPYPNLARTAPRPDPAIAESARLTNFLTLVLRDDPGAIGLRLDAEGWADVDSLVERANRYGIRLTRESLEQVRSTVGRSPFEWDETARRIRESASHR